MRALAGLVAGTYNLATLQTATCQQDAEDSRPMVRPANVFSWGCGRIPHDDDECGIEQAPSCRSSMSAEIARSSTESTRPHLRSRVAALSCVSRSGACSSRDW